MSDAHAGPDGDEDEQEKDDEAQEAGEAAPAQLAPAGPAPRGARPALRHGAQVRRRSAGAGRPARTHLGTSRRYRGTTPLSSLPHAAQRVTT